MSDPYMKLWVGDFLSDTLHLSADEVGQYLLLLMAMWKNGGTLPKDEKSLNRVARGAISDAVMAYFDTDDEGIYQKRLRKELENSRQRSVSAKKSAQVRWKSKPLKNNDGGDANAMRSQCYHSHSHKEDLVAKATSRRKQLSEDWKPPSVEGFSPLEIGREVAQFRDYHTAKGSVMKDWDAAFRTWMRNSRKFGAKNGASSGTVVGFRRELAPEPPRPPRTPEEQARIDAQLAKIKRMP